MKMGIEYKEVCKSCKGLHEFCSVCGHGFDKLNMEEEIELFKQAREAFE